MDDRVTQFRVGVLVVATCFIAGLLVMLFGEMPSFVSRQYTLFVRFPQAPGVTVDTPVLKSGILIGRVSRVSLLDDGAVVITVRIDGDRTLRSNEVCRISSGSIFGDALLEFVPSAQPRQPTAKAYQDGDYLDGMVSKDPLATATSALQLLVTLENDVRQALDSIETAGQQVGTVAEGLNAVVTNNTEQFQRILTKSEQALDRFDFAMVALDRFVGDEELQQRISESINQIPDLMTDASDVMEAMRETLGTFQDLGARLDEVGGTVDDVMARAARNLDNLEGLTAPLGERGEALTESLETSLTKIDTLLGNLITFSQALNKREGTLGQLIYDRELYDRIQRAAVGIEDLTRRARPVFDRLEPILNDVRIFSDKVSRDPGRIGVKGILDRRQSGTKR